MVVVALAHRELVLMWTSQDADPSKPQVAFAAAASLEIRCPHCRALLDEEDLFCSNCGSESPEGDSDSGPSVEASIEAHTFSCDGCGASMIYSAAAGALKCPFCGSTKLQQHGAGRQLLPRRVVPFRIERKQAATRMRAWLKEGWFTPTGLSESALLVEVRAVYVPCWGFTADTYTYWTADTSRTPARARASWYPISGQHSGSHRNILVPASGALQHAEMVALGTFELNDAVSPSDVEFDGTVVEPFTVSRKYARPHAVSLFERLEMSACEQLVPGSSRNLHVNVRLHNFNSEPVLVPVWIMAYRYQNEVFRCVVNGQTGRITGRTPRSAWKIGLAIALGLVAAMLLGGIITLLLGH